MEEAISFLKSSLKEEEFVKLTRTFVRLLQNILNEPENKKYHKIRADCKFLKQNEDGVSKLLEAIGFSKGKAGNEDADPDVYTLRSGVEDSLVQKKLEIIKARRSTSTVMGWDLPASCLKFSLVQGKGKFGDIFVGRMDDRNVRVKVMRPDCNKEAKEAFDRELDILSKVEHPNLVQLCGVTLTSEPTSLILEHLPQCLLDVLHAKDILEQDVLRYSQQLASAMQYLHQKEILHCDLAARNLLLAKDGTLRLSELGMSRWVESPQCLLSLSETQSLNVRWTAPEVFSEHSFTKQSDIWSYGIVLYELASGGSVPYATLSNSEVQLKVNGGYQLPQPQGCHETLYTLMRHCWAREPARRPPFADIIKTHLGTLAAKLASGDSKVSTATEEEQLLRSLSQSSKSSGKKVKVKEPSYQSVAGKGGGLVCIYTALLSLFHRRVVVVCSRKTTVAEAINIALAKCGKHDHDPKNHRLVLVSGPTSGSPARYLDFEDKLMLVKGEAAPTSLFVLCVNMPGKAPLELVNSVRQNPAYGSLFLSGTKGYLVNRDAGKRNWCVLDGSTLLCYAEEEDEGLKQFETYLDFKNCSVEPAAKGKSHLFKVRTSAGSQYTFLATSKDDMYQWVESINASSTLDPSPMLLNTGEGAVIQTGFVSIQEYAHNSTDEGQNSSSSPKLLVQRRLGNSSDYAGTFSAVDYGEHWMVLRSSGLVQCVLKGKPETLCHLSNCRQVKVHNPREMKEGFKYSIQIDTPESILVLKAAFPTEHSDWVLSMEQMLQKLDRLKVIEGHRKRESGYVALKRLLLTGGGTGSSAASSQLYCLPKIVDDMEDIYTTPKLSSPLPGNSQRGKRSKLLQKPISLVTAEDKAQGDGKEVEMSDEEVITVPFPLPRDGDPPPVPPRSDEPPPPLPPKGVSVPSSCSPLMSMLSVGSGSDPDEDYVMMQPSSRQPSIPPSPSGSVHCPSSLYRQRSVSHSPTQPITIPNRRSSKKSSLLRKDSDSSSCAPSPTGSAMTSLQEGSELIVSHDRHGSCSSSLSLQRQPSSQSLASISSSSYFNSTNSITPPSLPPRNERKPSSGYNSPALMLGHPVGIQRSQSCIHRPFPAMMGTLTSTFSVGEDSSKSDGLTISEAKQLKQQYEAHQHPVSRAESVVRQASFHSEGYASNQSSSESLTELPPGWARGYCDNNCKYFFFNTATGQSTWSLQEVFQQQGSNGIVKPGSGWKTARTDNGQAYYYNELTHQRTWNIQDTYY